MRHDFGVALREMQEGRRPTMNARPMQSVGKGVFELKDADDATWYRMLYLARIDDVIYVLDCFTKNTRKTESNTFNKARARLSQVRLRIQEGRRRSKVGAENKPGHITKGDVLEDLGFTPEEIRETEMKLAIWRPLRAEIEARGLTQAEVAGRLQIHQPDASLLLRGRLSKFSVMKLMQLAERLGLSVRLTVKPADATRHLRTPRSRTSVSPVRRTKPLAAKLGARAKIAAKRV